MVLITNEFPVHQKDVSCPEKAFPDSCIGGRSLLTELLMVHDVNSGVRGVLIRDVLPEQRR
jgi:hypothetical protein